MDIRARIEQEASIILGEDALTELKAWYHEILCGGWNYVVFVVRKSYMLALIMEQITGERMEDKRDTVFLTDASIMFHLEKIADAYRENGRFPRILLCDELLIHGRNMNHLLEGIEKRLCTILNEYDSEQVKSAFAQSMKMKVYMRVNAVLLLLGRYELNLEYTRREKPAVWHKFSSDVSVLIQRVNMANAAYIYSEHITLEQFECVKDREQYISTTYQNIRQYAKVRYVKAGEEVRAIFTMRFIEDRDGMGYRVIPFVFLPNLATDETDLLLEEILRIIDNEKYCALFRHLNEIEGKRSFNELLTLLFSQVFLQQFNRENNIKIEQEDRETEIKKLARNYNFTTLEEAEELVEYTLDQERLKQDRLEEILREYIPAKRTIFNISCYSNSVNEEEIKDALEDYFYDKGCEEEKRARELMSMMYFDTPRRSERIVRGCCFALNDLNKEYNEENSKMCMAYFLQMMDAGVLGISSFAPNNMKVLGVAQFAKAGEQSLLVLPLRMMEYMPLLITLQKHCERLEQEELTAELWNYQNSGMSDLSKDETVKLAAFLDRLREISQKPTEWGENYLYKKEFNNEIDNGKSYNFVVKQRQHMERYISYLHG